MFQAQTIIIPETPSPNFVIVKNISEKSSEKTVREFFLFCGKINEFELTTDDDGKHQVALINFERESAAKTASLLSNALIDECHIVATPYFESAAPAGAEKSANNETNDSTQEAKPKSRIAAEILASGYVLQDQIVAKGLEYDKQYNVSSRLGDYFSAIQSNVKQFDDKYRIWNKAIEIDQKFGIQEKVQSAALTAQTTAQSVLQSPTGQKVHEFANHTLSQIASVHYEAKRIQTEKALDGAPSTDIAPSLEPTPAAA
ncbi:hypothetical protein EC973_009651 [Apophysomyces ossiformis]|uniref:RRM domain-containing protein n=1 Tax=Apophysomyces ossiformis TaxID=679940 RepID=A0A8H7BQU3_9FUNG|nr:hypothetical protein EC973_009651 [Apophysomyces ossiformis]